MFYLGASNSSTSMRPGGARPWTASWWGPSTQHRGPGDPVLSSERSAWLTCGMFLCRFCMPVHLEAGLRLRVINFRTTAVLLPLVYR